MPVLRHADVVGLLVRERRELDAERREVQRRDLLVEDFRERVHLVLARAAGEVLARVLLLPELELRERLVRERVGHDERRVARGAAEVEEAALGEDDGALAVRVDELVDLGLDVDALRGLHEALHLRSGDVVIMVCERLTLASYVDLVVEVADVADDGVVAHLRHVAIHDDA